MTGSADVTPRPGLRERKKQMTRQAILTAAGELFAAGGYDGVTVAQIADRANVSVKTLFKYFDAKDDLVFAGENEMRDALVAAVAGRPAGQPALEAVRRFLLDLADDSEQADGVESFHSAFGGVPQLHARLLLMFERYEQALAAHLAAETGVEPAHPRPRIAAAQLVSLLRLIASTEAHEHIGSRAPHERRTAIVDWINQSADLMAGGLADYAVRSHPSTPDDTASSV